MKPSLDENQLGVLKTYVLANRSKKLDVIKSDLGLTCSKSVICRALIKMGLPAVKAPKRQLLTAANKDIRLIKVNDWVRFKKI